MAVPEVGAAAAAHVLGAALSGRAVFNREAGGRLRATTGDRRKDVMLQAVMTATITCPVCGTTGTETIATDRCQHFYDCKGCGTVLRARPGDCCVFCSHGDRRCPSVEELSAEI